MADVDLLGDPWTEARDPRGRKSHKRRPELAEKVALLKAGGLSDEDIAARIGLSPPTLTKYYLRELRDGPRLVKAVMLERMWGQAIKGNVSAARYVQEQLDRAELHGVKPRVLPTTKAPKLGKKAAADAAAEAAHEGTGWGDLLQ